MHWFVLNVIYQYTLFVLNRPIVLPWLYESYEAPKGYGADWLQSVGVQASFKQHQRQSDMPYHGFGQPIRVEGLSDGPEGNSQ